MIRVKLTVISFVKEEQVHSLQLNLGLFPSSPKENIKILYYSEVAYG